MDCDWKDKWVNEPRRAETEGRTDRGRTKSFEGTRDHHGWLYGGLFSDSSSVDTGAYSGLHLIFWYVPSGYKKDDVFWGMKCESSVNVA